MTVSTNTTIARSKRRSDDDYQLRSMEGVTQSERAFYVEAKSDGVALNFIVPVNHIESCRV